MATIIFLVILFFMTFAMLMIHGIYLIHRFQLLGYYNLKFIKWLEKKQYRVIFLWNIFELLVPLLIILILLQTIKKLPSYKYITSSIMILTFTWKIIHPFISGWLGTKSNVKIPLKYTSRVYRLIVTHFFIILLVLYFIFVFTATPFDEFTLSTSGFYKLNAFLLLVSVLSPLFLLMANIVNMPLEKLVHLYYFQKAKKKAFFSHAIKIAITGSYGKTSVKFFTSSLFNTKFKTLHTPSSYNTPMGISKVINTNNLDEYEVFVVEMGADKKGDINTLCKLVKPDCAIITAIDIQHLETFETLQNIIDTKLALFKNVNPAGFGIYNYDSEILRINMEKKQFHIPTYCYSIEEANLEKVDIVAQNIVHKRTGLSFTACFKSGETFPVKVDVLGKHNVSNLLAVILLAKLKGFSLPAIEKGLLHIKSVEHRLQKIETAAGVLVLDDAFNSNFNGAKEALRVLKEIEGNKKIVVTPGFIGLGEKENESNYKFGEEIAKTVDIAILVGDEKTRKIREGILNKQFDKNNLYVVNSLKEAQKVYEKFIASGDVILFENDLPDTYNE